jgi:hypothetical protein
MDIQNTNRLDINKILISNSLAVAIRLMNKTNYSNVEKTAKNVENSIKDDFKAQEYYGASIKKLSLVIYNSKKIKKTFKNAAIAENKFNSTVLMARACLDSLACVINRKFGHNLNEKGINPLNKEFIKTIHNDKLKNILIDKEFQEKWENITEYRNLIIHRSAVLILPSGKKHPKIDHFGILKSPHMLLSGHNPEIVNMDIKIAEIKELTLESFLKISVAML